MTTEHATLVCGIAALAVTVCSPAEAQIIDTPDDEVAGIPVNYTEAKVGLYTLPDPLTLAHGEKVSDAPTWHRKRRPEILNLLQENQYGRSPDRPVDMTFDVFDAGTPAFDGKALRKQVTIYFTRDRSDHYLPQGTSPSAHQTWHACLTLGFHLV